MQNVLVTGGAGFIGANFIRYLFDQKEFTGHIVNLDKLTYAGNLESLEGLDTDGRYHFVHGDICDPGTVGRVFDEYSIDSVCHFAAESHVDRSIAEPHAFIETNVLGTFHLLEASRKRASQIERFHHISTDEVYGSLGAEGLFGETSPYRPNSPYSASKASSDHIVRSYHKTYGLPITLSSCSNNYGPYQFPEKLMPLAILNLLEGKQVPLYGDGRHVRDWLYVEDHCEAVWAIMKSGQVGETYNIGGRSEVENIELIERLCEHIDETEGMLPSGPRSQLITFVKDRPGHDRRYAIDASKIETELGWKPKTSLTGGLKKTVNWYLSNEGWTQHVRSGEYQSWMERCYTLREKPCMETSTASSLA